MTEKDVGEIYDRLRETEAQTREQNERIKAITERVDSMLTSWDAQMDFMRKLIYMLIGTVISLALGPKAAEKLASSLVGNTVAACDIAPWHNEDYKL